MKVPDIKSLKPPMDMKMPPLDMAAFVANVKPYLETVQEKLKQVDPKALAGGLVVVLIAYYALFSYADSKREETLAYIASQIPSETVTVQRIRKIKHTQKNGEDDTGDDSEFGNEARSSVHTIEGLYTQTELGMLPVIRKEDNLTSFRAYQHPFSFDGLNLNKPVLSFIVVDYGLSNAHSENVLDLLPAEVSLMLSPYSRLPSEWVALAQDKGHEVWLDMPVQNMLGQDQGNATIFHHGSYIQKQQAMHKIMVRTQGYLGVSSYTDDSSNLAKADYLKIAEEIYGRGLGILELNPDAPRFIRGKAITTGAPYIQADMTVLRRDDFHDLEVIAQEQGYAVAIIPNYPETIKNLAVWILKIARADYIVAPVSALYDLPLMKSGGASSQVIEAEKAAVTPTGLENQDFVEPEE